MTPCADCGHDKRQHSPTTFQLNTDYPPEPGASCHAITRRRGQVVLDPTPACTCRGYHTRSTP